jgi:6-phosphogluconolactonase (cycloisomerase 2 family)
MRKLYTFFILTAGFSTGACNSYEDSFNRQINSTGLYVANSGSNTISQFAVDPKSGTLNDLGAVAAGTSPVSIAVNPAGTFAYAVNNGSNDVYVYSVNKTTRKLAYVSSATAGTTPQSIAFHASGSWAFVSNAGSKDISRYSIDSTSGALTSLGAAQTTVNTPGGIAVQDNALFSAISDMPEVRLFLITAATGALTASTTGTPATTSQSVTLRSSGSIYHIYVPVANGTIARSSSATWATLVTVTAGTNPVHIAFNPDNSRALAANYDSGDISIYSVSSGVLTLAATKSACTNPTQILFSQATFAHVVCRGENKVNAYTVGTDSLSLVGSYATGTLPLGITSY